LSQNAAVRIDRLGEMLLDKPEYKLIFERRWWPDGTSCLQIAKWGFQPKKQRWAYFWNPANLLQIPWELATVLFGNLGAVIEKGDQLTPPPQEAYDTWHQKQDAKEARRAKQAARDSALHQMTAKEVMEEIASRQKEVG
jgi:hypothetical protein